MQLFDKGHSAVQHVSLFLSILMAEQPFQCFYWPGNANAGQNLHNERA